MKTLHLSFKIIFLMISVILASLSCNPDDESPDPKNEFTISGFTVSIFEAHLVEFGENESGSFDWDIFLNTEGLDLETETGAGSFLYFDLNSDSQLGLSDGVYSCSTSDFSFTISEISVAINFDYETFEYDYGIDDCLEGTVEISNEEDKSTIEINITMSDNEDLIGFYKGVLQIH